MTAEIDSSAAVPAPRRPRVAAVAYTHFPSDPRVKREAEVLAESGFDVDVYCLKSGPRDSGHPRITLKTVPVGRYRGPRLMSYVVSYGSFLLKAAAAVTLDHLRNPYDLVHLHTMPDLIVLAALPLKAAGVPVILDVHDPMPEIFSQKFEVGRDNWLIRLLNLTERMAGNLADRVVTPTSSMFVKLASNGLAREKIFVIHNLPDPRIFGPPGSSLGREDRDVFRIVYHGTLAHRLGIGLALQSLAAVRGDMDAIGPWRFEILGDGDARDDFVRETASLDLSDHVSFSDGMVPVEELPQRLSGAALGLVPSKRQLDTEYMLPTKLMEYAYLGIPVLVSATRTVLDYFDDGVAVAPGDDPASWGRRILDLRRDTAERERQAREALRFFLTYGWEREAAQLLEMVRELVGDGPDQLATEESAGESSPPS